jgi:hypothetical protein
VQAVVEMLSEKSQPAENSKVVESIMAESGTGPYHEVMSIYLPFNVTGRFGIPIQDIVAKIFDCSLLVL